MSSTTLTGRTQVVHRHLDSRRERMRTLVALLMVLPLSLAMANAMADKRNDVRASLKKWGMAYCLGKFQQQGPENEAGSARGGYFQLGGHYEEAYQHVRSYFDRVMAADTRTMKETGKPNNLMHCLDAYERPEYSQLIKAQDRWIY